MKISLSKTATGAAASIIDGLHRKIGFLLIHALDISPIRDIECVIRYSPVVVSPEFDGSFDERWIVNRHYKSIDCMPKFDYVEFTSGSFSARVNSYLIGIAKVVGFFPRIGLSGEVALEFQRLLASVPGQLPDYAPEEIDQLLRRIRAAAFLSNSTRKPLAGRRKKIPPSKGTARISLVPDTRHAEHVGHDKTGRQFFLTTPFVPADTNTAGREFVALYLFSADGNFLEARIDDLGPRAMLDALERSRIYDRRLAELGEISIEPISIAPFSVERFGVQFGLIPRAPEYDAVEAQPGNYMAFFEPWDSGEYDS